MFSLGTGRKLNKHTLHEKFPYSEFFWFVFSALGLNMERFNPNAGKYGPEKLRISTLFTH